MCIFYWHATAAYIGIGARLHPLPSQVTEMHESSGGIDRLAEVFWQILN